MPASTLEKSDIERIAARFEAGESLRLDLPAGGRLVLDRGLPFLIVYRAPSGRRDLGTPRLVAGEAAVLIAAEDEEGIPALVQRLAEVGSELFGAFLILEIWAGDADADAFVVRAPSGPAPETVDALVRHLGTIPDLPRPITARADVTDDRGPGEMEPLITVRESWQREVLYLGVEVPPIYRESADGPLFPRFLRELQRAFSAALRQALSEFVRVQTTFELENYRALGVRSVPDATWRADRELAAIERSFSLLILTSPVNGAEAWEDFRSGRFQREPTFHYRLLPVDPDLLKRRLFAVPIEAIDDPALAYLMQDKREELDRQLSMLAERGSPDFRFSSMRLYGTVDDDLHRLASHLLREVPRPSTKRTEPRQVWVDAEGFRRAAEEEFDRYAARNPAIRSRRIDIRPDLVGLMVSEGNLLIGSSLRVSPDRVEPLIHHEIGTHVLTYVNGSAQPMEQLALGLAGYDELQEGLAVLAEYLCDGLDRNRMRLLAARVLAARAVEQGATFVETFGLIHRGHGFTAGGAWHIVARVFASGGFTRDFIYLRGLARLLEYLAAGGELRPLYVGKIAAPHVEFIDELRHRGVLRAPPLLPRLLENPQALRRLEEVRAGLTPLQLVRPEDS